MNVGVVIDEHSFRRADWLLSTLPDKLRTAVLPRALRSALVPATRRMRQLAPDSVASGSRLKWSRKMMERRSSTKQHKRTIGTSPVRKYAQTVAMYAGPLHPAGNLINVIGHDHRQMAWGRPTGTIIPANNYVIEAGKQTASQQTSSFIIAVRDGINKASTKQ